MTDQELLTYAAKAAGIEIDFESEIHGYYARGNDSTSNDNEWWNPLIDNSDAFELMVKLHMGVSIPHMRIVDVVTFLHPTVSSREHVDEDIYESTRRAITRAAAEIGKGMR